MDFPDGSAGKESAINAGDLGSIPELGRSPGEGKGYPLQYSGLENSMDCIVHEVAKSHTRLSDFHFNPSWWRLQRFTVFFYSQLKLLKVEPMNNNVDGLAFQIILPYHLHYITKVLLPPDDQSQFTPARIDSFPCLIDSKYEKFSVMGLVTISRV